MLLHPTIGGIASSTLVSGLTAMQSELFRQAVVVPKEAKRGVQCQINPLDTDLFEVAATQSAFEIEPTQVQLVDGSVFSRCPLIINRQVMAQLCISGDQGDLKTLEKEVL